MPPVKPKATLETDFVRALGELLNDLSLTEIAYEQGDFRVRVSRQPAAVAMAPAMPSLLAGEAPRGAAANAAGAPEAYAAPPGLLTAPMVGVVYTSAEPASPAFVSLGDTVAVGDTILLIEAMKVFNPIKAHRAGRVSRIFISNGLPVEYGEPLLLID